MSPQTEPPSDQDSGSGGGRSSAAGACAFLMCGPLLPEPPLFTSRTRTERSRLLALIIPVLLARRIPRLLLCPDASSPPAAPLQRWFQPGNANVGVDVRRTAAFNPPPHSPTLLCCTPPPPLWFGYHAAEGICVFFVIRMMSLQSSFLFCPSVFGSVCLLGEGSHRSGGAFKSPSPAGQRPPGVR